MVVAFILAGSLLLLALFSIRRQLTNLRRLRQSATIPSDDRSYLRNQALRRLVTGVLMLVLSGMLAGVYLSGMDRRADELGQRRQAEEGEKPPMTAEEKDFLRFYSIYWITILVLVFLVLSLAVVDLWSTRRYAWQQIRRIQSDHRAILERDLAMYRQQRLNDRMRGAP